MLSNIVLRSNADLLFGQRQLVLCSGQALTSLPTPPLMKQGNETKTAKIPHVQRGENFSPGVGGYRDGYMVLWLLWDTRPKGGTLLSQKKKLYTPLPIFVPTPIVYKTSVSPRCKVSVGVPGGERCCGRAHREHSWNVPLGPRSWRSRGRGDVLRVSCGSCALDPRVRRSAGAIYTSTSVILMSKNCLDCRVLAGNVSCTKHARRFVAYLVFTGS